VRPGPLLAPLLSLSLAAALAVGVLLPGAGGFAAVWAVLLTAAGVAIAVRGRIPETLEVTLDAPALLVHQVPSPVGLTIDGAGRPLRLALQLAGAHVTLTPDRGRFGLPTGGTLRLALTATGRRRGRVAIGPAHFWVGDPIGLWERRVTCELGEVEVHPRAAAAGGLRARRLVGGAGRPRPVPGAGTEFRSLRPYVPGDDPRTIHWPATARLGTPICRTWSGEESPRVFVAVDVSRRMSASDGPDHTRLDRAVEAAISLVSSLRSAPVGAAVFDRRVLRECALNRRGLSAVRRLLYDVQPTDFEPDYAELFRHLRDRLRRRTLVVLLTSPEGDDGLARACPLLTDRHRVLVAAVGDRALRQLAGETPDAPFLDSLAALHSRASAATLLADRRRCLARVRAAGASVIDADASELEPMLRAHYLRLLASGPV